MIRKHIKKPKALIGRNLSSSQIGDAMTADLLHINKPDSLCDNKPRLLSW